MNDSSDESSSPIELDTSASPCVPLQRQYPEPIVFTDSQTNVSSTQNASAPLGAVAQTATALTNLFNVTLTPMPLPSGTPQAAQQAQAQASSAVPTMTAPATYTAVALPQTGGGSSAGGQATDAATGIPATSVASMNAVAGGNTGGQGNANSQQTITSTPVQIDSSLQNSLNAGEIDDNAEWDVYLEYRDNFLSGPANTFLIDDVDVTNRQIIEVLDTSGNPILGAVVTVMNNDGRIAHQSCTYATGLTQFFPNLQVLVGDSNRFQVIVTKADARVEAELNLVAGNNWLTVELDVEQSSPRLDLLFLFDSTGSMDDEIAQLRNNILYISQEISEMSDDVDVRYALVTYKDGHYPTELWDFTYDVSEFQFNLAQLYTAGGDGETLNDGLDRALHALQWRGDDTMKLIFLIGDEPPGIYENHPSYAISMLRANTYGIKIHPIASSGLDIQGEYIFRQIAQASMGHFIFLTYADGQSGIAGTERDDLEAGASGEYTVEHLHEIVLNLILEEISVFRGES